MKSRFMTLLVAVNRAVLRALGILELQESVKRLEGDRAKDLATLREARESVENCTAAIESLADGLARVAPVLDDSSSGLNAIVIGRLSRAGAARATEEEPES